MKLFSWNINGLRAILGKGFAEIINEHNPDVVCLQEIKAQENQVPDFAIEGYDMYWNSAERKGYSGTMMLSKIKPLSVQRGLGEKYDDNEGRVLTLEFDKYFLVTVYVPNAKADLSRLDDKQVWDKAFREFLSELDAIKPVIVCGDFNVAHQEIDLARPKPNVGNAGFTNEEREDFTNLLKAGFVDVWREKNPETVKYSWWSYRMGARGKNVGWRIDYFVTSARLLEQVKDAQILNDVMGSDHCPVWLELKK